MTLAFIIAATAIGGLLSVLAAAALSLTLLSRLVKSMVSLSAGVLLGTSLLHLLPGAFESQASPTSAVTALLGALLFFWRLEKFERYRHVHHHEGDGHGHQHHRGGISG